MMCSPFFIYIKKGAKPAHSILCIPSWRSGVEKCYTIKMKMLAVNDNGKR